MKFSDLNNRRLFQRMKTVFIHTGKTIGENCDNNNQCNFTFGLECIQNTCSCPSGKFYNNHTEKCEQSKIKCFVMSLHKFCKSSSYIIRFVF